MPHLPTPLRATLGLVAKTIEDARALPTRVMELPVVAVTEGMKLSLRVQQQYTGLVSKGDELIAGLRGGSDEPPTWATFDEDLPDTPPPAGPSLSENGLSGNGSFENGSSGNGLADDESGEPLDGLPPVRRASALRRANLPRDRAPSAFDVADDDQR